MAIIPCKEYKQYIMVGRMAIEDPNIIWEAAGLLVAIEAMDTDIVDVPALLAMRGGYDMDAVLAMIGELITAGYLVSGKEGG